MLILDKEPHDLAAVDMATATSPPFSLWSPVLVEVDEIDPLYSGAMMVGKTVTLDFVMQMIDDFKNEKCVHQRFAHEILLQTKDLLLQLPSLVDIVVPDGKIITVCGDVHGQFYDLINIFEINGFPSDDNPYIFNGDFVDRGAFSLEIILTLLAFKCLYPNKFHLSRGNHESRAMNELYGFEYEVFYKLNHTFVDLFAQVFCCLPLAYVINDKVLVIHGGLFSKDGVKLSDIRDIDRFCEPPQEGLMCELLWSDPKSSDGRGPNERGVGLAFGPDVTKKFLDDNELDLVVRSHEVKEEGYDIEHDGKLITVFSAPNYLDQLGNKGAMIRFEAPELKYEIVQFTAVAHPEAMAPEAKDEHLQALALVDDTTISPLHPVSVEVDEVPPQYSGATMEGKTVTLDFIHKMIDDFKNDKCLHQKFAYEILLQTKELLHPLPTLVDIVVPDGNRITVCGDVHGQFYDLLNIFEVNGFPSEDNPYLFNGDFVDRGSFSVEVILTLFAFKCLYPNSFYLARGNHESKIMNKMHGFEHEVVSKLNNSFVDLFAQVFCCLPLAHLINDKILVIHGGLFSNDGVKLSDIRAIDRFQEPPQEGIMCELLWSDPKPDHGRGPSPRGLGISFGPDVTKKFIDDNELDLIVRSHEMKDEGYDIQHDGKLVTVFSAPNYCDQFGNKGALIRFEGPELKYEIVQFSSVDHPEAMPTAYSTHFLSMFSEDEY